MSRMSSIIKRFRGFYGSDSLLAPQRANSCHAILCRFSIVSDAEVGLKEENELLANGLLRGDRACLARLITLIESQRGK